VQFGRIDFIAETHYIAKLVCALKILSDHKNILLSCYLVLLDPFWEMKLHKDPTNGPHPKAWTNGQRWNKWCQRWACKECLLFSCI